MNNNKQKKFISISEKYTPQVLDDVIEQYNVKEKIKEIFIKKVINKILIFYGKSGLGKHTCINILIKKLTCYTNFDTKKEKNLYNIFRIDGIIKINICDIKNIENIISFFYKKKKNYFIIFYNIQMISQYFLNFFFQLLFKKYKNIIFIIISYDITYIPSWIISKSVVLKFTNISTKNIFLRLKYITEKENIETNNKSLLNISQYHNGSIGNAIKSLNKFIIYKKEKIIIDDNIVSKKLLVIKQKFFIKFVDCFIEQNIKKIFSFFDYIYFKESSVNFIIGLKNHFKNLLFYKKNLSHNINKLEYIQQSQKISSNILYKTLILCYHLENEYNKLYKKFIIKIFLIKIYQLFSLYKKKSLYNNTFFKYIWINFINNEIINKINPITIKHVIQNISFVEKKDKILLLIPYETCDEDVLIIKNKFIEYKKKMSKYLVLKLKIIKKKKISSKEEQNTKFINKLANKLNLKIY